MPCGSKHNIKFYAPSNFYHLLKVNSFKVVKCTIKKKYLIVLVLCSLNILYLNGKLRLLNKLKAFLSILETEEGEKAIKNTQYSNKIYNFISQQQKVSIIFLIITIF